MMENLMNMFPDWEDLLKKGEFGDGSYHYKDDNIEITIVSNVDDPKEVNKNEFVELQESFLDWVDEMDDSVFVMVCDKLDREFVSAFNDLLEADDGCCGKLRESIQTFLNVYNEVRDTEIKRIRSEYNEKCKKIDAEFKEAKRCLEEELKKFE